MAAKKKTLKRKSAKAVPSRRGLTVRQQARAEGAAPDAKAVRSDKWSPEWLAIFSHFNDAPEPFAKEIGVSYYTIWRIGTQGHNAGFKTAFLVRQWCTNHNLRSPI
jgi:hypothetical protein